MLRTLLTTVNRRSNQRRHRKRLGLSSLAIATFGIAGGPCLASDQDQACTKALAQSSQLIKATYGPVVNGVELAGLDQWDNNSPYHPDSEQLSFVLRSQASGKGDAAIAARAHTLMANQALQANLSRAIEQACPSIDVVSFRFEHPSYSVSYSRQSNGVSRRESSETVAQAPILLMP